LLVSICPDKKNNGRVVVYAACRFSQILHTRQAIFLLADLLLLSFIGSFCTSGRPLFFPAYPKLSRFP